MSETLKLTNGQLQRMKGALQMLGNRHMEIGPDLKVAKLLRALAKYVDPLEAVKRKAALAIYKAEVPEGATLSPQQEQLLSMLIAEEQAKVDDLVVEVELPMDCALTQAELPKPMSGPNGWTNAVQRGALIADLGPVYLMDEG